MTKSTGGVADAACRRTNRMTGLIRNESSFLHPSALSAVSLRLLSTYEGFEAFIGAFCHPRHDRAGRSRDRAALSRIVTVLLQHQPYIQKGLFYN